MSLETRVRNGISKLLITTLGTSVVAGTILGTPATSQTNYSQQTRPPAIERVYQPEAQIVPDLRIEILPPIEEPEPKVTLTISDKTPFLIEAVHSALGYKGLDLLVAKDLIKNENNINSRLRTGSYEFVFDDTSFAELKAKASLKEFAEKVPVGSTKVYSYPTIGPEFINEVLAKNKSPAAGIGQYVFDTCVLYEIDPAFALAFFKHESTYGRCGVAKSTRGWGNVIGKGPAGKIGRFRAFHSWKEGFLDWCIYMKKTGPYYKNGRLTVGEILPVYAPSYENDTKGYIRTMGLVVRNWRQEQRKRWD